MREIILFVHNIYKAKPIYSSTSNAHNPPFPHALFVTFACLRDAYWDIVQSRRVRAKPMKETTTLLLINDSPFRSSMEQNGHFEVLFSRQSRFVNMAILRAPRRTLFFFRATSRCRFLIMINTFGLY